MKHQILISCTALLLMLSACDDDESPGGDNTDVADAGDAGSDAQIDVATETGEDTGLDVPIDVSEDSSTDTADVVDTSQDLGEEAGEDIGEDAADVTEEADASDAGDSGDGDTGCPYFEYPRIIDCGGELTVILWWSAFDSEACPEYYTFDDEEYATLEELAEANECDDSCEYIGVGAGDLIGCVSGHRTGFEWYEAEGEGCLESVYITAGGLMEDLCDWDEWSCNVCDCPPDTPDTVGPSQLLGFDGIMAASEEIPVGQSFIVTTAGVLSGIEVLIDRCETAQAAQLVVYDSEGFELGRAELDDIEDDCSIAMNLAADTTGPGYFDLAENCIEVEEDQVLRFLISPVTGGGEGVCGETECTAGRIGALCGTDEACDPYYDLGIDNGYDGGTVVFSDEFTVDDVYDLAFKVFIR